MLCAPHGALRVHVFDGAECVVPGAFTPIFFHGVSRNVIMRPPRQKCAWVDAPKIGEYAFCNQSFRGHEPSLVGANRQTAVFCIKSYSGLCRKAAW